MELALEQLLAENAELSWAVNLEFGPSLTVNGFGLPFTGEFSEFDHSDYMAREEFFENIHALDLDHSGDRKLSRARARSLMTDLERKSRARAAPGAVPNWIRRAVASLGVAVGGGILALMLPATGEEGWMHLLWAYRLVLLGAAISLYCSVRAIRQRQRPVAARLLFWLDVIVLLSPLLN